MPNYQAHDKMYLELINNMFRVSFVVKIYNCSLVFFYLNIFFIHGNRSFLNYYLKFIFFQITIYFFFCFNLVPVIADGVSRHQTLSLTPHYHVITFSPSYSMPASSRSTTTQFQNQFRSPAKQFQHLGKKGLLLKVTQKFN